MKLSTRARYAVRMMTDLADRYGEGPVLLKDVARREDISEKYLSLIVIPLRTAGLVQSKRGARGGYRLAREPADISVNDILVAVEGPISMVDCISASGSCSRISVCPARDVWGLLGDSMTQALGAISLTDLVQTRRQKNDGIMMENI